MWRFRWKQTRTPLGKFLDKHRIEQEWLIRKSGLGRNTVGDLANNPNRSPTRKTMQKILKVLREFDSRVKADDFWDM
ncbi:helix-turn-helix domain-containing protein [Bacillus mycoides]|uniref:helix-turn-helix domain-containing protein n=1 Tax=Bacillus mycoides TaxID=1405 RepID=UPI003D65632B